MKCREFGITCVRERESGVGGMELSEGRAVDVNVNFVSRNTGEFNVLAEREISLCA